MGCHLTYTCPEWSVFMFILVLSYTVINMTFLTSICIWSTSDSFSLHFGFPSSFFFYLKERMLLIIFFPSQCLFNLVSLFLFCPYR